MSLKEEFKDKEYRQAYAESFANTVIATQIRLLRGSMTQQEFANLVGVKQSRVSAMEDENYSMWSTTTLKKLAAAKDVVFLGRFVSFGELLNASKFMSAESLKVTPFMNDPAFAMPSFSDHATFGVAQTTNAKGVTPQSDTSTRIFFDTLTASGRYTVPQPKPAKATLVRAPGNIAA